MPEKPSETSAKINTEPTAEKLSLASHDPSAERLEALRELFPDAFTEGALDPQKLAELIGQSTPSGRERYGLGWAGKAQAHRAVQSLSTGTLRPAPDESVNFDSSENLIIEGDNLEVLKLMQKSYARRVKMIYIDPPYNTGNEFIYPDNFREGLQTYLEYSGQVKDGVRQTTNTESSGRYHSNWLNMMYPRLFLARNLLKEDGVIFVTIDDHEVHNLRLVMNEIFGEENFVACAVWQKKYSPQPDEKGLSALHDYVVIYARSKSTWRPYLLPRTDVAIARYKNPDNDPRGVWKVGDLTTKTKAAGHSYPIESPSGKVHYPTAGRQWGPAQSTFERLLADNKIWFGPRGDSVPALKQFLSEVQDGTVPVTWWKREDCGDNQEAVRQLNLLMSGIEVTFDTPKPTRLIERMLKIATTNRTDDIVLDFFAGSGTTAQAVLELNNEDGGNRRFILVQLPEATGNAEYSTIADITKERVRRAITKLNEDDSGRLSDPDAPAPDRGFKVFKLDSSNFKVWDADAAPTDAESLAAQLQLYTQHLIDDRTQHDVLYEMILKSGRALTVPIEAKKLNGQTVYCVQADEKNGVLLICLAIPIHEATLREMIALAPSQIICLDCAFEGKDQLKNNIVLQMKDAEINFRTV